MNIRALMSGEPNVADLALFPGGKQCLQATAFTKDSSRIGFANHFVALQEINVVGLQAAQRFVQLLGCGLLSLAVNLGHEESFLTVAVSQRFAHAFFADASVVVPAVVEEVDSAVERGAYDADAFLFV